MDNTMDYKETMLGNKISTPELLSSRFIITETHTLYIPHTFMIQSTSLKTTMVKFTKFIQQNPVISIHHFTYFTSRRHYQYIFEGVFFLQKSIN